MILEGLLELRHLRIGPDRHPSASGAWWGGGFDNQTGVPVTEFGALENTPVWQAVMLISGFGAATPLLTYSGTPPDRDREHRLHFLLHDEPNPESTAIVFKQAQWINRLLWGNSYAEVVRDSRNAPQHLYHLPSWLVCPYRVFQRAGGGLTFEASSATPEDRRRGGTIMYEVSDGHGAKVWLSPLQMFHVPYMTVNGIQGVSPICTHPEAIALGLAMQHSAAHVFSNAALLGGVLERPANAPELSPEGEKTLLAAFNAHQQGITKRGRVAVTQEGTTFKEVRVPLHELQFIENLKNQVPEVARIFNVPPYFLGHDGSQNTYSNVPSEMKRLYLQTLRPLMVADQQEISRKLISVKEYGKVFVEYETKSFLEADPEAQARVMETWVKLQILSKDQAARIMNFAPLPPGKGGYYEFPVKQLPPASGGAPGAPPKELPPVPPADDEEEDDTASRARGRLEAMLCAALQRAVNRETKEIRRQVERLAGEPAAFLTWVDSFYSREWPEFVRELVAPGLGELEAADVARRLSNHHRGELRSALATQDPQAVLGLLDTWTTATPAAEAALALSISH